jgi:hypothetical protein
MNETPILRVRSQKLSLWQSVVWEHVFREQEAKGLSTERMVTIQKHPMMVATNQITSRYDKGNEELIGIQEDLVYTTPVNLYPYLSSLGLELGEAYIKDNKELVTRLETEFRKYSDKDPGFLSCAVTYAEYYKKYNGVKKYNDWQIQGKGDLNYGVIRYKLPNKAKVAILGDWGTGMDDAIHLLKELMVKHKPDAIIHLGDIYYSATPLECSKNFSDIFTQVFNEVLGAGKRIPVFSIPGNHDYYAFGYGYYTMVEGLNEKIPDAVQRASYFCLQTEDGGWQFLGMDTGFDDANPADQINPFYSGPQVHASEVTWLKDKLNRFDGSTILLSHHQLFSANNKINGMESAFKEFPYLNNYLLSYFQAYFSNKIAAWLWGHEHNLVLYKDNLCGLNKGRLVGCSAYEELTSANPYNVNYPEVPYLDPTKYRLDSSQGYYNHGYAIIDFSQRSKPTDNVKISYYQYPSWGDVPPKNPEASLIYSEDLQKPVPVNQPLLEFNQTIYLSLNNMFTYFSQTESGIFRDYYPTLGKTPIGMQFTGKYGPVLDGDIVNIKTLDKNVGAYNLLGAFKRTWLYYYKTDGSANEQWIIRKVNQDGNPQIRLGDSVYLINVAYQGQYLTPTGKYLTTKSDVPTMWTPINPNSVTGVKVVKQEKEEQLENLNVKG